MKPLPLPPRLNDELFKTHAKDTLDYLVDGLGFSAQLAKLATDARQACYLVDPNAAGLTPSVEGGALLLASRTRNPGHLAAVRAEVGAHARSGPAESHLLVANQAEPFTLSWAKLERAQVVFICVHPLDAMALIQAGKSALALLDDQQFDTLPLPVLVGKQVVIVPRLADPDDHNRIAGLERSWALYDLLTAQRIRTTVLDQSAWFGDTEVAVPSLYAHLREGGEGAVKMMANRHWKWPIVGQAPIDSPYLGRRRIFLPDYQHLTYFKFLCHADETHYAAGVEYNDDEDTGEQTRTRKQMEVVCSFRLAQLSRVEIQSYEATTTGTPDAQPMVRFAATVQVPRERELQRLVLAPDKLHNVGDWKKAGGVLKAAELSLLISMMERTASMSTRKVANFVGLCWRDEKLVVQDGSDCYFDTPDKQCPYHNLRFASGSREQARQVLAAYAKTFTHSQALLAVVWALGAHLKTLLGFWPHLRLEAAKGSGKSTLLDHMAVHLGVRKFGRQQLQTSYRMLQTLGHTSQPVSWEELSSQGKQTIADAEAMLQEGFNFAFSTRNSENLHFLSCAPVLIAGEEVDLKNIHGKIIQLDITDRQGAPIPYDTPRFPMREWLAYLATQDPKDLRERINRTQNALLSVVNVDEHGHSKQDKAASRMVRNYSVIQVAGTLLTEWAGFDGGTYSSDLITALNRHLIDSENDREPFVWILQHLASELGGDHCRPPFAYRYVYVNDSDAPADAVPCLVIKASDVMHHMASELRMRSFFDNCPVKSDRVFKGQLVRAGMLAKERHSCRVNGRQINHGIALDLEACARRGVEFPVRMAELAKSDSQAHQARIARLKAADDPSWHQLVVDTTQEDDPFGYE